MNKLFLILLTAVLVASAAGAAATSDEHAFLKARHAYYQQDKQAFERQASRVSQHDVLYPYLEYWRISGDSTTARDVAIADFITRYPGTLLAEKLRADWLQDLGAQEAWPAFLAEYQHLVNPDLALQCYARRAELAAGDLSNLRAAVVLWFTGSDLPAACTPLFSELMSKGYLYREDVWRRFWLALSEGNASLAQSLAAALPSEIRPDAAEIDNARRDPARFLEGQQNLARRAGRELAVYAYGELARIDPDQAAQSLERLGAQLPEGDRRIAWGIVACRAALLHHAQSLAWFERAGAAALNDYQRAWWARAALRAGQWGTVIRAIDSMGLETQGRPVWTYWKARALSQTGQVDSANALFSALAGEPDFYGLLASGELGKSIGNTAGDVTAAGEDIQRSAESPGIALALALYDLGLRSDATAEWIWATRSDSDRQLLAAAELARRHQWFDRAVTTAEKTREQHNFDLRFLAPYREQTSNFAHKYGLDEAWIYGIIRQESRFCSMARSGAGALGLMQLMPATAHRIARKLGWSDYRSSDVTDPDTNIQLGAEYLRMLLDHMDEQPVLATAGYNAGPGRAERWRDALPMEGAVYIESIPVAETRSYVKKVMSNAMFYAARFGRSSVRLKEWLGVIPGAKSAPPVAAGPEGKSSPL
ncbi:MAG: transglycosylase SLT domain-containing protein [Thiobacillaceae bacterium]